MKSFSLVCALLAAATLTACPSRPTTPTPPPTEAVRPRPVKVPQGCEGDLSGQYRLSEHPDWSYSAVDDGGTLVLHVARAFEHGPDAGAADGGVEVVLERTADGFVGTTRTKAFASQGVECAVQFPTELVACPDGGLLLSSVETVAINESCVPARVPRDAPREQHLLLPVRAESPEADGGVPAPVPN